MLTIVLLLSLANLAFSALGCWQRHVAIQETRRRREG
jgi:hypothetical protein